MSKDFHTEPFDASTIKKLEIFRKYIREWLPVFLATNKGYKNVALYDFFAGPGKDATGIKGSPLIIIEEVQGYLGDTTKPHAQGIKVNLYFNDDAKNKYLELDEAVKAEKTSALFDVEVENKDFGNAFEAKFSAISAPRTANLIILDQSGVKHVTEDVFRKLIDCITTDILFFISSAIIKRFAGEQGITRYFPVSKEKIKDLEAGHIHRFICDYYRKLIPTGKEYYLAPFSIKKEANIYGVIFGSNSLRGLEKFLGVCWKLDPKTGEANYNIDRDVCWNETKTLFKELDTVQKMEEFQQNLTAELQKKPMTNRDVYRYCVEGGFLPKHANEILTALRSDGKLVVSPEDSRGFYIGWDYYCGKKDKVVTFRVKE